MNCFFCNSDISNFRATGMSKPAGSFSCHTCPKLHGLNKVICTINVKQEPLEAIIYIDRFYYFRIDYYGNQTFLVGPQDKAASCCLMTMEGTSVTPAKAKQKLKTYLIFS